MPCVSARFHDSHFFKMMCKVKRLNVDRIVTATSIYSEIICILVDNFSNNIGLTFQYIQ